MRTLVAVLFAAAVVTMACGDTTGPERNQQGTGTSTLRVTADIDALDVTGGFTTEFDVSVRDGVGSRISGATVTITNSNLGTVTLPETGTGTGDYFTTRSSFPSGAFELSVVRGSDNDRDVVVGGVGAHTITAPTANSTVPANQPLTVRWTRSVQAQSAELETRDYGPVAVPDNGQATIPAVDNPVNPSQRIRVFRFNEVVIGGGLAGSRFRLTVRRTVEPVNVQ